MTILAFSIHKLKFTIFVKIRRQIRKLAINFTNYSVFWNSFNIIHYLKWCNTLWEFLRIKTFYFYRNITHKAELSIKKIAIVKAPSIPATPTLCLLTRAFSESVKSEPFKSEAKTCSCLLS